MVAAENWLVTRLGSDVDLFANVDGAIGDFQQSTADILSENGVMTTDITVDNVELFEHTLADQAAGARYNFTIKRKDGSQLAAQAVQVAFRHGRLEGAVTATFFGFTDIDKANMEGRVKDLARQLNDQITHVLSSTAPSPTG